MLTKSFTHAPNLFLLGLNLISCSSGIGKQISSEMYGPIQSLNSKTALAQMFVKVKVTVDVTSTPSLNLTDITCSPFFESNMALLSMRSLGACLPSALLLLLPEEKKKKKKVRYLVWQNILCCVHNTVVQFKMVSVHPEKKTYLLHPIS